MLWDLLPRRQKNLVLLVAFNVDLRDYAPSFKVTRAAKGSRGGAIGGGQPMDTQEVSVAPLQKPAQFNFSQTIQEREQQPINIPNYSSQLDDLKKQLEALSAKKPEPAPTPPVPAPAPSPVPSPQPDNSARDAWNAVVAQQGKWNLWLG